MKSVRLRILNAVEDVPQLISAYAKGRGWEFALAIRPHEGKTLCLLNDKEGTQVLDSAQSDVPALPRTSRVTTAALAQMKAFNKEPKGKGPMTLRGRWSGTLTIDDDGSPSVAIKRKVAAYGTLHIQSDPDEGWTWRTERSEKWFSKLGDSEGGSGSLKLAIEEGMASMMNLLGEACSFRDSRRRAAFDDVYAEKYPVRPARVGKDPLGRLKEKTKPAPRRSPSKAKSSAAPSKPKASPARARTSAPRAPSARSAMPPKAPERPMHAEAPDAEKDALLMAAFSDTLKSLLAGG